MKKIQMNILRIAPLLFALSVMAAQAPLAMAQEAPGTGSSSATTASASQGTTPGQPVTTYIRPTEKTKFHNYLFDAFGPYAITGAAIGAGIGQAEANPPEWGRGVDAFVDRFGSNYGIAAITTTTRYGLAEAFRQDTIYYRCECKGFFRRLGHTVTSTLTARRGDDGHREFSVPALVSPYVGSMTAVYGWYPDRYGYKDAVRMGSFTLLWYVGQNIATEFIYGGPHPPSRVHLTNSNGSSKN